MKAKLKSAGHIALLFLGGMVFCYLFYIFVDMLWNGVFMEWFRNRFLDIAWLPDPATGKMIEIEKFRWPAFKSFLKDALLLFGPLLILVVYGISHLITRSQVRTSIARTGSMIQAFMNHDLDSTDVFPTEYAAVATQMIQLKSEMQRHEQVLREENSRKNDLITYLAHDLKTPLTSIIGYLSLLDEAPDMPPEQRGKYVHITLDKAIRLEKLINEFFEITRYNLQQILLEKETIDLSYMLIQMTDEFYPILHAHDNTADLHVEDNLMLYGDPEKLARVFNNILKNAVAYSYPGTPVEVWAKSIGDQAVITFCNKGKTIPAQKLNSLFEKFFRLDDARTTNTGGAGLGLAIAKEIVTLHGGTISAESQNGLTTFRIALPLEG
ncbi:sensor histidine kinase [Hominifimenecus sp. rT4P-3]|uniref:sensor histidine kinase n=1 Tax=Hominifimenecus sp. rT4P-3 TaxID=3242979 RepID=UPI003DA42657